MPGVLERVARWYLGAEEKAAPSEVSLVNIPGLYGGEGAVPHPDNPEALLKMYREWVYVCATKIAEGVGRTPLKLYVAKPTGKSTTLRRTRPVASLKLREFERRPGLQDYLRKAAEIEEVVDHPFYTLWQKGNPHLTGSQLQWTMVLHMALVGDSYCYIVSDEYGPQYLIILPPGKVNVQVARGKVDFISGYVLRKGTEKIVLKPDEVMHNKYPDPSNPVYGMAPLEAVGLVASLYHEMNVYEWNLLQNNAVPGALGIAEAGVSEPDKKRIERRFNQRHRGPRKAGKFAVITGPFKIEKLGLSQREMLMPQLRKLTREDIAGAYGVHMALLVTTDVNRANAEVGRTFTAEYAIKPACTLIEDGINRDIIPKYGDEHLFVAFDDPVPEDREFQLKKDEVFLKTTVVVPNEIRQREGLEDREGGDEPIAVGRPAGLAAGGVAQLAEQGSHKAQVAGSIPATTSKAAEADHVLVKMLRKYSKVLRRFVLAHAQFRSVKLLEWLERAEWDEMLADETRPIIGGYLEAGGASGMVQIQRLVGDDAAGAVYSFDVNYAQTAEYLRDEPLKFARKINATLDVRLRTALEAGLAEGESPVQLAARVNELFDGWDKNHSLLIARTEEARAMGRGSMEAYRQSGVVRGTRWLASPDACQDCLDMADMGERALFDSYAENDYELVMHPPLHPNCVCTTEPVLFEVKPEEERV